MATTTSLSELETIKKLREQELEEARSIQSLMMPDRALRALTPSIRARRRVKMFPEHLAKMIRVGEPRARRDLLQLRPRPQQLQRFLEAHLGHECRRRQARARLEFPAECGPLQLMDIGQLGGAGRLGVIG